MKLKSLLFGSAAVLAAGTGAQAADLPTVEPVEYVRICDAFGTGFFYIPGTDTCLKLSGYVRAESHFVEGVDPGDLATRYGTRVDDLVNNYSTRVRGHVEWDARTQTDVGLIRAFIALEGTRGPNASVPDTNNTQSYSEGFGLASAFIQISNDWGTYTAGKFGSFFDFWGDHSFGSTRIGIEPGTEDPNLFAWTFAGGNGFSLSLSAEDPDSVGRRKRGDDDYEGLEFPDGVANIRVDQGWGSAQIMGVVHAVHDKTGGPGPFEGNGDDDHVGWAAGAGLGLNIPGGWRIDAQGGYSEGAIRYISGDPGGFGDIDKIGPNPRGRSDLNESWAVRGGITGPLFNPNLTFWADGNYIHVEEGASPDEYDFWGVIAGAKYTLAPGLQFGPEFAYNSYDVTDSPKDGIGEKADYDIWGVMWRIQRSF
jgi:hypothetical protein